jgi:hypothetical protein
LNYIIKGEREPRLGAILALMDSLEVSPQELFNFGERKKR